MVTRFAVLPDSRRILLGVDKANIFEEGMVYQAIDFDGEIVLKKIGKYALKPQGEYPSELSDNQAIISDGRHLCTVEEYEALCNQDNI